MKMLSFAVLLFVTNAVLSQDTLFLDVKHEQVRTLEECDTYEVLYGMAGDEERTVERSFYRSGQLIRETYYKKFERDGRERNYYKDGQLASDFVYAAGQPIGQARNYWPNGKLKHILNYADGKQISAQCFDEARLPLECHEEIIVMPHFPGESSALNSYLYENIQYPRKSKQEGIHGKVILRFLVDKEGNVSRVLVIRGVNEEIDAEAVRVIAQSPRWEPGRVDGEAVPVRCTLPIRFKLD